MYTYQGPISSPKLLYPTQGYVYACVTALMKTVFSKSGGRHNIKRLKDFVNTLRGINTYILFVCLK